MGFPMDHPYVRVFLADTQAPPIVSELEAIFAELPDEELLARLKGPKRRGPKGHDPKILWRCYVALYYLGLDSVSTLIRTLYDNPFIAAACGIKSPDEIPSQPTFSRFGSRLAKRWNALAVKNVMRSMTRRMYRELPDFGKSIAIDSTDIKGWSNASQKGHSRPHKGTKRRPGRPNKVSDPDCGWIVKKGTQGVKKFVGGYKVHIACDTTYELPIAIHISPGNVHDVKMASPFLSEARFTYSRFLPDYVICDKGYSDAKLRRLIKHQYHAEPIIDPHPTHKKTVAKTDMTAEWKMIYNRRVAVERLNGRLKAHRRLNSLRVRGRLKVFNPHFPDQPRGCVVIR